MSGPFQPVGERARWEMVYDALTGLDVGDVITYEQIAEALDTTVERFRTDRGPFYKAANEWGSENRRALAPVNGVGYRVVDAAEHELLARRHHRKSKRALARGRRVLENADRSRLSEKDRQRFDAMEQTISRHQDMIRRLDIRQRRVEGALSEASKRSDATEARVAALEETLRRHGIEPGA